MFCSTEATVHTSSSRLWGDTSPSVLCRRRSPHSPPWCRCWTSTRTKTLPGSRRPSKLKVRAQPATCWKLPLITVGVPPLKVYWDQTVTLTVTLYCRMDVNRQREHAEPAPQFSVISLFYEGARSLISSVTVRYQITVWLQSSVSCSNHTSMFLLTLEADLSFRNLSRDVT